MSHEAAPEVDIYRQATKAVESLREVLPDALRVPRIGIICGSGLSGLANTIDSSLMVVVPFAEIPYFAQSTVQGHAGNMHFGKMGPGGISVVMMVGRLHFYEGHSIQQTTFPIRVMKLLGVDTLIVTNAAGGLGPDLAVGDIMVINDHLNLAGLSGCHPLRGPNVDLFGPRFPALSDAYDLGLRRQAHQAWQRLNSNSRKLHEGVYAYVGGPSYETRAECRLLRNLGADVVGMSTVPEVIVARHSGIRVLALSLVTNNAVLNAGPLGSDSSVESLSQEALRQLDEGGKADHGEVLEAGRQAAADMEGLVHAIVEQFPNSQ